MFVEYMHLKVLLQLDTELALNQHITFIQIITHSQLVTINIALLSGFMGAISLLCFRVSVSPIVYFYVLCFTTQKPTRNLLWLRASAFSNPVGNRAPTLFLCTKQALCFNAISHILYLSIFNSIGAYIQP